MNSWLPGAASVAVSTNSGTFYFLKEKSSSTRQEGGDGHSTAACKSLKPPLSAVILSMRSTATNPVGEATEVLMALAVERILSKHATTEQRDKARLAMRADLASPGVESCVVGKLGLLHDYAEHLACELINEVLVAGQEPCAG